jgi:hypothetical protein
MAIEREFKKGDKVYVWNTKLDTLYVHPRHCEEIIGTVISVQCDKKLLIHSIINGMNYLVKPSKVWFVGTGPSIEASIKYDEWEDYNEMIYEAQVERSILNAGSIH